MSNTDDLARLAAVIESRKPANGGDPETSYVARLLHKGPDAFLKKIGEEATEALSVSAKTLCIPFDQPELPEGTICFHTGKPAKCWTLWGQSYYIVIRTSVT